MLSDILHFIEFMFVFALALIVLFVVLLIVVSKMPHDNPLRMILSALSRRVGVTGGLMIVDPVAHRNTRSRRAIRRRNAHISYLLLVHFL
jgi:hypothetical protein